MEPIGTPLLIVRRVMLSHDGRPLEFGPSGRPRRYLTHRSL
ncbi:hypothetical protein [Streptosporangium sp. NPDC006007]